MRDGCCDSVRSEDTDVILCRDRPRGVLLKAAHRRSAGQVGETDRLEEEGGGGGEKGEKRRGGEEGKEGKEGKEGEKTRERL